jgi:23S rRNA-intervening sequence protein
MARSYRELLVWQKAKVFAVNIYRTTEQFPKNETYGLTLSDTARLCIRGVKYCRGPRAIDCG